MGALVVEVATDREFAIIDGQQRLATLSILALAVISRLGDLPATPHEAQRNAERASALRARFIGEKDPASLIESSKLSLNETDDPFYQDYLVQLRAPRNPRGLPRSQAVAVGVLSVLRRRLAEDESLADGERLAEFLAETVGRQLMFILITVEEVELQRLHGVRNPQRPWA